jgi:hypothetical protein
MRVYRLRIRNTADDAWEHTFTTEIAKPPQVGQQTVRPLQGRTESRPWIIELVDASEAVTDVLVDANDRYDLLRRKADVSYADDGGAYTVLATGRISDISLAPNQALYRIELHDERLIERNSEIFTYSDTTKVWPPGTTLTGGYWAHRNEIRIKATHEAYSAPIASLRLDNHYQNHWPPGVRAAINDDVKGGKTTVTASGTPDAAGNGSFNYLRCRADGADYEVMGFAYTNDQGEDPSSFPVGSEPAHDDNMLFVFVHDSANALSGLSNDEIYLYFPEATDDEGNPTGYAPTEDVPLHVEGQPFVMLQAIYDGVYGGQVVAYDSTAMTALQTDDRFPPNAGWRITKGPQNMAKWVEENIYRPFWTVPLIGPDGEVVPTPLLLTDATEVPNVDVLTALTAANVSAPVTWSLESREQVTRTVFNVALKKTKSAVDGSGIKSDYDGALDRYEDRLYAHKVEDDVRIGTTGAHVVELDYPVVYTTTQPGATTGTVQWLDAFAWEWLDRLADGALYYTADVLSTVTEGVGDWLVLDADTLKIPNKDTRAGDRVVQVISRTEKTVGARLQLLDGGPKLQPLNTPTAAVAQNANDPKHTLRITVTGLDSGARAQIQMARSDTTPNDGDWWSVDATTDASLDVGGLRSGTKYYVRCRAIADHRIGSAWSTPSSATTQSLSPPTAVYCSATNTVIYTSWTNGEAGENTQVYFDTVSTFATTATHFETFVAGTTECNVEGLATTTLYWVFVRHIDEYGGVSATDSDSATTGSTSTLAAPDGITIISGSDVGTYTAP